MYIRPNSQGPFRFKSYRQRESVIVSRGEDSMENATSKTSEKTKRALQLQTFVDKMTFSHFIGMPSKTALYGTLPVNEKHKDGKVADEPRTSLERVQKTEERIREFHVSHFVGMPSKAQLMGTLPSTGTYNRHKML